MKATAQAPANIAFIKYWGKADEDLRIPLNDSFSMNLTGAHTVTTVEFVEGLENDDVTLLSGSFSEKERARVIRGLDRIRERAGISTKAKVVTRNSFPKGAGSAASASGFAALTVAAFRAAQTVLTEKELTIVARLGSGSACRSIPDGFVLWEKGTDSESSFARSVYPSTYWDLSDLLVIVDRRMKKVPTSEGMESVSTSPKLPARLAAVPRRLTALLDAFERKDIVLLGRIIEEDCLDMHEVMQTQVPPLRYWNEGTRQLMDAIVQWRRGGLPVYFTIDAGPNVHCICEATHEKIVRRRIEELGVAEEIIENHAAAGTRLIDEHLF